MGYPLRPKNLKKSGFNDDNVAALRDLQRRVSALTEGQPNTNGVGALTWDEDRGTYNIAGTGETSFKIGEDLVYYAKNTSGSTIPIGSSVMFTGAVGASGLLTFGLAVADGSVDPDYMMGITQQEIPHNGFGYVKHFGLLRGFRTDGVPQGETWSDGDLLYFDAATPGSLTKVKPVSPALHEPIAVVVTATSGNSGSIFVRMKVSESLATLRDVYVNGSLTNGDVLIYDVTQDRFEANTLTAGANISITNGPGSITISSAGGVETDPIFTASPAFGITSGDISNWDTAYGWGNHALAGYLTSYTETDPTVPAHVKSITTGNISNWNTAYGWGDHSAAGYLTSFTETDPTVPSHVKSITTTNISNWNTAYGWGDHSAAGYLTSFSETDPTVPSHVKSITATNISNWNTAYSWGNHATAGYQAAATALTTSTTFGGDVSGTYNAIVVADDSHNHVISNVDGLQTALDGKVDLSGDTMSGDLIISKADARLKLYDSTGTNGNNPYVEWETTANQGIAMELNVYDSDLPVSGYGLVVREGPSNGQFPTTGTLTFNVLGEIYAGATSLGSLNKVFHGGYAPFAGLTAKTSGTGTYQTNGDFRAPIFYDSDNTAYYTDPASTSILSGLYLLNSGPTLVLKDSDSTGAAQVGYISFHDNGGVERAYVGYGSGSNTDFYIRNTQGINNLYATYTLATGSVRSPLFFDSDNTGYYVDPASTGSAIVVNGYMLGGLGAQTTGGTLDWNDVNNVRSGSTKTLLLGSATNGMGGAGYYHPLNFEYSSKNGSGNVTQMAISYGSPGNRLWMRGRYSGSWSSWVEFLSTSADFQTKSGHLQSNSSLRAPIFYDSQNTGYYVDPTGTSNFSTVQSIQVQIAAGHGRGYRFWASDSYKIWMSAAGNSTWGGRVAGETTSDYNMYFRMSGGTNRGFVFSAGSAGTTKVAGIDASGNGRFIGSLGIGGASANNVQLTVAGAGGVDGIDLQVDTTNSVNSGRMFWTNGTAGQGVAIYNGSGNMYLTTGATPNSTSGGTRMAIYSGNYVTASGSFRAPVFYDSNNTGRYADLSSTSDSIRASGDIVAYYSDDRLKDRGDNIANALDKVQSLNGFHYTANETAQKFGYKANPQVGVSAQEVEAVLPEVVKEAAIGHGYKTVDYAKLVPLLIEAIKELKAEVEILKKG